MSSLAQERRKGVTQMLAQMNEQGYAHNVGEWETQTHIAAIAAPILAKNPASAIRIGLTTHIHFCDFELSQGTTRELQSCLYFYIGKTDRHSHPHCLLTV